MLYRNIKRASGFTLIELLVVISIIALLLSILMPALSKVKKQATNLICSTRMRDLNTSFMLYVGDNSKLPTNYVDRTDIPVVDRRWFHQVARYYGRSQSSSTMENTTSDFELFRCPTQDYITKVMNKTSVGETPISPKTGRALRGKGTGLGLYGYNWYFSYDRDETKWSRVEQIRTPSELPLLADMVGEVVPADYPPFDQPGGTFSFDFPNHLVYENGMPRTNRSKWNAWSPAPNHGKHINYAFADGHVEKKGNSWPWTDPDELHLSKAKYFHPKRKPGLNP